MARPDTWMPFYWGDFWRDTGHLSPAEGWAYINLIGAYWVRGAPLEADEGRLQRLAKVTSLSEWERVRKTVLGFFTATVTVDGDCYSHSRIDRELVKAKRAYSGRVEHMARVNAKRKKVQSLSPVTATDTAAVTEAQPQTLSTDTVTQPQPQSPYGEKHSSNVSATSGKASRIPEDWKPSEKDIDHARGKGLDPATITAIAEQFRDHWRAKPRNNTSLDWSRNWRTWVANHIGYHGTGTWPAPNGSRANAPRSASPTTARDSILAKAGLRPKGQPDGVQDHMEAQQACNRRGDGNPGTVIDADDWRDVSRTADGTESHDTAEPRDHSGPGGADGRLPQAADRLPGGCDALRAENPSGSEPLVAVMGGVEGPAGDTHVPPPHDAGGIDHSLDIPGFPRRIA